jgi:DNA-binding response OmpR family regulator
MAPPAPVGKHVAVIEDDPSIGSGVLAALQAEGFRTDWHHDIASAVAAFAVEVPDLVLLDVGLPDGDGFSLCRRLRQQHRDLPIVMVTARDADVDVIVGLDAGATDYVTKPFSTNVLLARVRAHLRGSERPADEQLTVGPLTVDVGAYRALLHGRPLELRPREFQLLAYLAARAGRVVSREQLLADVWDLHWDTSTKTVDMHVVNLRRQLGDEVVITAVRGVGYRLERP